MKIRFDCDDFRLPLLGAEPERDDGRYPEREAAIGILGAGGCRAPGQWVMVQT